MGNIKFKNGMVSAKDYLYYSFAGRDRDGWGMVARFPVDGRQGVPAQNVVNTPEQKEPQITTARTTRATARRAGGSLILQ